MEANHDCLSRCKEFFSAWSRNTNRNSISNDQYFSLLFFFPSYRSGKKMNNFFLITLVIFLNLFLFQQFGKDLKRMKALFQTKYLMPNHCKKVFEVYKKTDPFFPRREISFSN